MYHELRKRGTSLTSLYAWERELMKFYDCSTAPSARRVRIFMAEKGIGIATVRVDLRNGEQFSDAFRKIKSDCMVPVLEPDDGTVIADAISTRCSCLSSMPAALWPARQSWSMAGRCWRCRGRELTAPS